MRQTTNYQLPSWDSDDRILRTDFNDLTEKVDTALAEQAESITGLTAQLAAKGNCQLYTTTYEGKEAYGAGGPMLLTFPKPPLALLITGKYGLAVFIRNGGCIAQLVNGDGALETATWFGNSVSWYNDSSPMKQMSQPLTTYYVVALIEA